MYIINIFKGKNFFKFKIVQNSIMYIIKNCIMYIINIFIEKTFLKFKIVQNSIMYIINIFIEFYF
jgi:hypothetical protein